MAKADNKAKGTELGQTISIKALNYQQLMFKIAGTAPYVQHAFGQKAMQKMMDTQKAGQTAKSKKVREPRDFDENYRNATHRSVEGWCGIPAPAFRAAMISACRLVGFKMTLAKLAVFIKEDGFDPTDGTPLVRIQGDPEKHLGMARNANGGTDIRCRPMWKEWSAVLRIGFDADVFTSTDIANLVARVGAQVGIGEGRPDSKMSSGLGWGTFKIVND